MRKTFIAAALTAALTCAAVTAGLALRYPDMPTAEASTHAAGRALALVEERLFPDSFDTAVLEVELAEVRSIALAVDPDLDAMEPLALALALRNMLYRMVPLPRDIPEKQPPTDFMDLSQTVQLALFDEKVGHSCGGLTILYITMLKAFGIEARYVGLFHEVVDAADPVISHATVDVFIDGRWIALDPTFNFSIRSGGERIGWEEARALTLAGEPITFETDGYALLPHRSITEYPHPLTDSIEFMIFAPTPREPMLILPESWNGRIDYANGKAFDMRASLTGGIYVKLAQPTH